ncbi:hypothetical protein ACTR78_004504, partial [Escherichia coli]
KEKFNLSFAFRRQVEKQNKMIKNQSGNNANIISPWNYGHYGEMINILKRYCMATGTDSAEDGVFHDRHMISVILRTPGSGNL